MEPNISSYTSPASTLPTPQPKRHIVLRILLAVIVLAVIAGVVFLIVTVVKQNNLNGQVKDEVIKQNKTLKASAKNGLYSLVVPPSIKSTDAVTISATVAQSGLTYCLDGTSKANTKIAYHMTNTTDESKPEKGNCSDQSTVTEAPTVPASASVLSASTDGVTLGWNASPFAASYTIQCATDKSFVNDLKTVSATTTKATVTGLTSNTDYYCRVAATNAKGTSPWSNIVTVHIELHSPQPANVKTTSVSKTSFKYSFDAVPGATSYNLQYTTDINFMNDVKTINTTSTSGTLTGLQPSSVYYIHIQAITPGFDASTAAYSEEIQGYTY